MRYWLLFIFFSFIKLSSLTAGLSLKDQKITQTRVEIYADNTDNFPYTITVNYQLNNCNLKHSGHKKILIPANATRFPINEINLKKGYATYSFTYQYWKGNQLDADHDENYLYGFPCDEKYKVIQGYHGHYSHKHSKSLDFEMPVGTPIYAARDGIVLQIKEDSKTNCTNPSCMEMANYILILHADGSIANYAHLQYNGVIPKVGDSVQKGQKIGLSGNTGWSGTPHLHFEVYTEINNERKTEETSFINSKGKTIKGRSYPPQ